MKINLKLWLFGAMSVMGLILLIFGFFTSIDDLDRYNVLFQLGPVLAGLGLAFFMLEYKKVKCPEKYEKDLIEQNDERNVFLKYKAGDKVGRILLFVIIVLMLLQSFHVVPNSWFAVCPAGLMLLYVVLYPIFYNKYYGGTTFMKKKLKLFCFRTFVLTVLMMFVIFAVCMILKFCF